MLKDWILPFLAMVAKATTLIGALVGIWVASGFYHAKTYRTDADAVIKIRVRSECLRPDYVQSELQAREWDVTEREVAVLADKTALVNYRLSDLIEKTERFETLRREMVQGKVGARMTGIGGPAPSKR